MSRNVEIRACLETIRGAMGDPTLTVGEYVRAVNTITSYIEKLERENLGLNQKCTNYARKEQARKREMGWSE